MIVKSVADDLLTREPCPRLFTPSEGEHFALFDTVLGELLAGRINWAEAYRGGFPRDNDDRFYFVGYEMAKALERHRGRGCIGEHFGKPPVEFFRRCVALYRKHPDIRWRFSREAERLNVARR